MRARPTLVLLALLVTLGTLAGAATANAAFVTRAGTELRLGGQPYRFAGINIYNANNSAGCWYPLASGPELGAALDEIGGGAKVVRAWFFQNMATTGGARDWSAFDHTLQVAAAHGARVIATLTNQWPDCDGPGGGAGSYKDTTWYETGYRAPDPSGTVSYRDWVAEVAARYRANETVLAWQLINEAEVKPSRDGACEATAATTLKTWAADVAGVVKAADANHLVSLGTIGGGQCGTSFNEYQDVHDLAGIDLCEYHDYGAPTAGIPGDEFNGLQKRIDQCAALSKPLIVGETGIRGSDIPDFGQPGGRLTNRAFAFEQKFRAQFAKGIAGELVWAWNKDGSSETDYDIGPGDPLLHILTVWNSPSRGTVSRVNTTAAGVQSDRRSIIPHVTADGRYVLFVSEATLSPDDTYSGTSCGAVDSYLKDTTTGAIELVNLDSDEHLVHGSCGGIAEAISGDGRYVVFQTGDTGVYVRDRVAGTTQNVAAGANGRSGNVSITPDGRYVLFASQSTNLGSSGTCGLTWREYVYDRSTGTRELASPDAEFGNPCQSSGANYGAISGDGRYVAFVTNQDLVEADVGGFKDSDIYLRDRTTGDVVPVSVDRSGSPAGALSVAMSADGRSVAFISESPDIVAGDTNATPGVRGWDAFVWDRVTHAVERASVDSSGHELTEAIDVALSDRGRFVYFTGGHIGGKFDPANHRDLYVRDRQAGTTERVLGRNEVPAGGLAASPATAGNGRFVVFSSTSGGYVDGDTNDVEDIFLHERSGPVEAPPNPDVDGDGVHDAIAGPTPGSFNDGAGTTGSITVRNGLAVTVSDAAAPDGVRVVVGPGTGQVTIGVCGFTVRLNAGGEAVLTCGSVIVKAVRGAAQVVLGGGATVVVIPEGGKAEVKDAGGGSYSVLNKGTTPVSVIVDGVATTVAPGATSTVRTWHFAGFFAPVNNNGVVNVMEAGRAAPLLWRLTDSTGRPVTTLSGATVRSTARACPAGASDAVEVTAPVGTPLVNLGLGFYALGWKSDKAWAGTCRTLELDLGEGVTRQAVFRFTR
jgi:Tol biopolymer transport system component